MAIGPGKYDADCTAILRKYNAGGVILMVFGGDIESGFSCTADFETTIRLPEILRRTADMIEKDTPDLGSKA